MAKLSGVTRESLLGAIAAFDREGREAFLESVGANPSNKYFITYRRKKYDPKAIVARAAGTTVDTFSGGRSRLDPLFVRCGFKPMIEGDRIPIDKPKKSKSKGAPPKAKGAAAVAGATVIALAPYILKLAG